MTEEIKEGKQIHINFFETACTENHECAGQWRSPGNNSKSKDRLEYYINIAKLAEKAKITSIFFTDTYAGHDVCGGNVEAAFRAGTQVAQLDPLIIISAMAAVTKSVSFGVTGSTTFIPPFALAQIFSSLDHFTDGRIAWNVATGWSKASDDAFGKKLQPHDKRCAIGDEYMDTMYRFLGRRHAELGYIRESRVAYEPSRIKKIEHNGKYLKFSAWHQMNPSPQRCPIIFQAGQSRAGLNFAAKYAELIYIRGLVPSQAAHQIKTTRKITIANGSDPTTMKFFACVNPTLGRIKAEAEAKYKQAMESADVIAALAPFSGYIGIGMSVYPLDEEFVLDATRPADNTVRSFIGNFTESVETVAEPWRPRRLGAKIAIGFHPSPVGDPAMVADVLEQWIQEAVVDGFNIAYISNPGSFEDIVELLVPELLKRKLMSKDYAVPGGTFRENVLRQPGQKTLKNDHYGSQFKFEGDYALPERYISKTKSSK